MTSAEPPIGPRIDHTVLGPETTAADVHDVLHEAMEYDMNACIPPCYVADAADVAPEVPLATVIGFPHGNHVPDVKRTEAERAVADGADELDLVANIGALKADQDAVFQGDIETVTEAVDVPVKVILEAPLLSNEELHRACEGAMDGGAAMLKTATGFSDGGATIEDVALMREYGPVKASGGIGSWKAAKAMFDAGAKRIGASAGDVIAAEFQAAGE